MIDAHLGRDYPWPGNVRELSQCVSNFLIHRDYRPMRSGATLGRKEQLADDVQNGRLGADELLTRYCTLVYAETGSYVEAARRLGLDRRTVKSRIDPAFLAQGEDV